MSKRMLVNAAQAGEIRVAIVDNNVLEDLNIASEGNEQIKGNVYRARVVSVESGLQAAFVDYGADRNGFITFNDIDKRFWTRKSRGEGRPRIQDCIDRGAELLVQAYKEEMGNKGAALTTDITLPGRYLVIMPFSGSGGVSRKIEDEEARKKLKDLIRKLNPPEEMGIIVRTAGMGASRQELEGDYQNLVRVWAHIHHQFEQKAEPGLIYQEQDVVIRSVRDYFTDDIDEVVADNPRVHQRVLEFFQRNMPGAAAKVKLYAGKMPIFSNYGLERQLENIVSPRVPLKSGGYIIINPTEALTAIDVNSGKSKGQDNQEQMAFQTNQEAAEEVARQLRLRDLGGLIVVDFIDMEDARNRREVERVLKKGMKLDKARVEIGRVSRFGLLELSRQRIKARLLSSTHKLCPTCEGSGYVLGTETSGLSMLRRLQELAVSAQEGTTIRGRLSVDVALFLLNKQREALSDLEEQFKVTIEILPDAAAIANREAFELVRPGAGEKAPEERRGNDKRSRDRERERERADKRSPKTRLPPPPRLQSPTKSIDEPVGDDETDEDESPFEPPRIVGYVAPEKLVTEAPAAEGDEGAEGAAGDEDRAEGDESTESGDRNRRRRRRKGRGGRAEGQAPAATPAPPTRPTPPVAPSVTTTADEDAEDEDNEDEDLGEGDESTGEGIAAAGEDGEARRRRRRRRRRKGGRNGEGAQAPQAPDEGGRAPAPVAEPRVAAVSADGRVAAVSAPVDAEQARREEARNRNRARREGRAPAAVARVLESLGEPVVTESPIAAAAPSPAAPPAASAGNRVRDRLRQKAGLAPTTPTAIVESPAPVVAAPAPVVEAPAPVVAAPAPAQIAGRVKDRLRQKAGLAPAAPVVEVPAVETPAVEAPVVEVAAISAPSAASGNRVKDRLRQKAGLAPAAPAPAPVSKTPVVADLVEPAPEPVVEAAPPPPPPEQVAGRVKDRLRQKAGLAPAAPAPAPAAKTPVAAAPVAPAPETVVEVAPPPPPPPPEQVAGRVKDRLRQKAGLTPAPSVAAAVVEPAAPQAAAPVAAKPAQPGQPHDRVKDRLRNRRGDAPVPATVVEPVIEEPVVEEPIVQVAPPPPPEQVASRVKDRLRKKAGLETASVPVAEVKAAAPAPSVKAAAPAPSVSPPAPAAPEPAGDARSRLKDKLAARTAGAPKADAPKADAPKADAPKADAPQADAAEPAPKGRRGKRSGSDAAKSVLATLGE